MLPVTDAVNYRFVTPKHSLKWHMVAFSVCAHGHGFEDIPPHHNMIETIIIL